MAEITTGLRSILSVPAVYETFQRLLGSPAAQRDLVANYIRPHPGEALLDIGCGPGNLLRSLPDDLRYVGFDPNESYVKSAAERYGTRGSFFAGGIDDADPATLGTFDIVMAKSVLHHVDDRQAAEVFDVAARVLRPGGRVITLDNVYVDGQSRIARFLISRDRGQNVRTREGYEQLARARFSTVETHIRHDRLRVPYTHIILTCREQT